VKKNAEGSQNVSSLLSFFDSENLSNQLFFLSKVIENYSVGSLPLFIFELNHIKGKKKDMVFLCEI
jgi:hypothetical protein